MSDQPPGEPPFEYKKWVYETKRRDAERAHDRADDFFNRINEAAIRSGDVALRTAVLINGGAAVAMLAFIGGLVTDDKMPFAQLNAVVGSLTWFAYGVASAVAGMAFSYFTNYCMAGVEGSAEKHWEPPYIRPVRSTNLFRFFKMAFHIAAVIAGVGSLLLFIWGMLDVRDSIGQLAAQ